MVNRGTFTAVKCALICTPNARSDELMSSSTFDITCTNPHLGEMPHL